MAARLDAPAATLTSIGIAAALRRGELDNLRLRDAALDIEIDTLRRYLGEAREELVACGGEATAQTVAGIDSVLELPPESIAGRMLISAKAEFPFFSKGSEADRLAAEFNRSVARIFPGHGGDVPLPPLMSAIGVIFATYAGQLPQDQLRETIRALTNWMLRLPGAEADSATALRDLDIPADAKKAERDG